MKRVSSRVLAKERLGDFVSSLARDFQVFGPVQRRSDVSFQEVSSPEKLKLDYSTTTLPPKKFFHHREDLITYDGEKFGTSETKMDRPLLLFGVHSCDLNAILRMDRLFSREFVDSYYARRRTGSTIVALSCTNIGENCFCSSLGTGPTIKEGFDLLLTDIGGSYLVEVGTSKGKEMIRGLGLKKAASADLREKERRILSALSMFGKRMRMDGLSELSSKSDGHEVWALIGKEGGLAGCFPCLSCGNCSLVCPTCYCYDIVDLPDLSLWSGVRKRELDSCQLLEYAEVALGGNFRPDRVGRIRHWMRCKYGAAGGQLESSCVGCGRCIHACPARIDLTEVARRLWGE